MESNGLKSNHIKTTGVMDILFVLLLFAFPFLHVTTGLSVSDTG